ncbi:MAG: hypothetical protein KOO62_02005 [candidate division Zixibacteria bacterium]|nr:hypothetical protein [candidate division Zixibacteria bacterium]
MVVFLLFLLAGLSGNLTELVPSESTLDSNTAFYEGRDTNYILSPPRGFGMEVETAQAAGYSFAFVPDKQSFDSADILIGATIYNLASTENSVTFETVMTEDTARLRAHYGEHLLIWPVDSMMNFRGDIVPTFYFNDPQRFIPTVLVSYYDGGTEAIILELNISDRTNRVGAERVFETCLNYFKVLKRKEVAEK